MDYILFHNFEDGVQVFGYYGSYEEAKESYDSAVEEYSGMSAAVEVGIAEIQKIKVFNWPE